MAAVQAELKARKAALDKFDVDGKGAEEKLQKDHQLLSKVVAQATTVLAATDRFKDGVAALQQVSSPALLSSAADLLSSAELCCSAAPALLQLCSSFAPAQAAPASCSR